MAVKIASLVLLMVLPLAGCSGARSVAEESASASPSATAHVMQVESGTDEINIAVGQSVNFQTGGSQNWGITSSDEQVFQVFVPTDDVFTPDSPGGVGRGPGKATVTMTPPGGGLSWSVLVRVIGPTPSATPSG